MRTYEISYLAKDADIFDAARNGACAEIDIFHWQQDYTPRARAFLAYNEEGFRVCLTAYEQEIRCEMHHRNDMVCLDSCLEFFFAPDPSGNFYFNFESNPLGTLYIGCSATGDRSGTGKIDDAPDNEYFRVTARTCLDRKENSCWQVAYDIPFAFIRRYMPGFSFTKGDHIHANFYKCGEQTKTPHWGSWSPIEIDHPEYHSRRFFGDVVAK